MEISIITVTKNRKDILKKKLESIGQQTVDKSKFELILLNNNSKDGSKEDLEKLDCDFNIEILNAQRDLSISEARNLCVKHASGKYLYFSDDDCLLEGDTLEKHLQAQEVKEAAYMGAIDFVDETTSNWMPTARYWYLNGANCSIPKVAFDAVDGFDEDLQQYGLEDLLLGYELKNFGLEFEVLKTAKVKHMGPAPLLGKDLAKAFSAGQNSVIVIKKYPELKFRLGITDWLLLIKRLIYLSPIQLITKRMQKNFDYERVYLMGVLEQKQMMEEESV